MKKLVLALVIVAGALVVVVRGGTRIPDDIQPIAWNAEPCAHCHMLIGDPHYAAQVITTGGQVLSFDDPGCAARWIEGHRGEIHRAWFHAGRGDTWIPMDQVAFVQGKTSPMGSGMIAVPRGTPGAVALEDIR